MSLNKISHFDLHKTHALSTRLWSQDLETLFRHILPEMQVAVVSTPDISPTLVNFWTGLEVSMCCIKCHNDIFGRSHLYIVKPLMRPQSMDRTPFSASSKENKKLTQAGRELEESLSGGPDKSSAISRPACLRYLIMRSPKQLHQSTRGPSLRWIRNHRNRLRLRWLGLK